MSTRVLFMGIDAMDARIVSAFAPVLPNLSRIRREGLDIPIETVHPPDSDTAWATISTGWNPAEHGIVRYDDALEKTSRLSAGDVDNSVLRGRTFWDAAGRAGKRVCVLFPHLGYPVWPVNGVMIGRSGFHEQPDVYPAGKRFPGWNLADLNVVRGIPAQRRSTIAKSIC